MGGMGGYIQSIKGWRLGCAGGDEDGSHEVSPSRAAGDYSVDILAKEIKEYISIYRIWKRAKFR